MSMTLLRIIELFNPTTTFFVVYLRLSLHKSRIIEQNGIRIRKSGKEREDDER